MIENKKYKINEYRKYNLFLLYIKFNGFDNITIDK